MGLFDRWKGARNRKHGESAVAEAVRAVEHALREEDIDPAKVSLESEDPAVHQWALATEEDDWPVVITVNGSSSENAFLQVHSPVMHLPPANPLAFYRRLLEANSDMVEAAFSVDGDIVHLESSRTVFGIDAVEVRIAVKLLSEYIEEYVGPIRKEFDAPPICEDD